MIESSQLAFDNLVATISSVVLVITVSLLTSAILANASPRNQYVESV